MFIYRQKQKGMVLICAVAILAVLSIMATSFVRMMTLNLQAAKNHLNYVDAKFAAIAGIEDAKARMWEFMLTRNGDLNYTNNPYSSDEFPNNGTVGRTTDSGKIGRYDYNGNQYNFRIRSNQGKLNLNSHRPYDLDYSTEEKKEETECRIENSNRVMNTIIKCLAETCKITDATKLAEDLRPIDKNIKTFNSMQEVELILQHYGTAEQRADFLNNVCVNSVMDSLCYVPTDTSTSRDDKAMINDCNTSYYREYRSPININSVSEELLTALIQSINATVYIYSPYHTTVDDYGFTDSDPNTTESSLTYAIAKYTISFSQSNAETIANSILGSRPYTSIAHIESEIQKLTLDDQITRPSVTYLMNTSEQNYINDVRLTNILKDTLKANFNPNVKENFYNGAYVSARCVQKSDLYSSGNPTHSTELCILDCGYADIESNGVIQARVTSNNPVTVAKASIKESISFGTVISATSYNDFSANSNAWIFPELSENNNGISSYMNNLQSVCGSVQCQYHGYRQSTPTETVPEVTAPENFVKTKDGLLMKDSFNSANTNVYTPYGIESSSIGIASFGQSFKFWVKLAEDWYEPTMCGLFSGSYRNPTVHKYTKWPVSYNSDGEAILHNDDYHDGMQLYVYKNTKGELRLSRLFFCGYFKNGSYYGIQNLQLKEGDDRPNSDIAYARRDICIDLGSENYRWHANEWHCIDVHWSEVAGENTFYVIIDNKSELTTHGIPDGPNTDSPKFCVLNENISDDAVLSRVQMNSMYRTQYNITNAIERDKRLFRFDTIASLPGNSTMKENSLTNTSLSPLSSYSINFSIDKSDNQTDPNKNPLLNYDRKKVTGWGVIGALTWIAYPEGKQMHSDTSNTSPDLTSGYIKMSSEIHNETSGNTNTIIPSTSSTVLGTSFSCSAEFENASQYPTVLDSVTLNIMYPLVFSSTIVQ